jgi:serine/threonine-protein kinase SRPK3
MTFQIDYALEYPYVPIEGVERLENYRLGGYHPIAIGDTFCGRYRVVYKLGHGSYSTIWLARDEQLNKYVAIKVCIADSNPREIDILRALTSKKSCAVNGPGETLIPLVLDSFKIQGPNGSHSCYATIPARISLSDAKDESVNRLFQLDVARALAAQLLVAVEYIHSRGFAHGDLHMGNILLQLPFNLDQLSIEKLHEKYQTPHLEPVVHIDGKPLPLGVPSHAIIPVWFGKASDKLVLSEAKILLTDFGETFSSSMEPKYKSLAPLGIRPPESRFEPTKPLSSASDIWMLACTIWTIVAQRPLFEEWFATEDDMTCEHVDALGILPLEWWQKWEQRRGKFTEDGFPINRQPYRSWEDRFENSIHRPRRESKMSTFDQAEQDAISAMLRSMLSYRPEDRPTIQHVLKSEWMVKWALPEYEKIGKSP